MRVVLLIALIAGCADDGAPDPSEVVDCVGYPVSADGCEAACADYSALADTWCEATSMRCLTSAVVDGAIGCCSPHDESPPGDIVTIFRWQSCE